MSQVLIYVGKESTLVPDMLTDSNVEYEVVPSPPNRKTIVVQSGEILTRNNALNIRVTQGEEEVHVVIPLSKVFGAVQQARAYDGVDDKVSVGMDGVRNPHVKCKWIHRGLSDVYLVRKKMPTGVGGEFNYGGETIGVVSEVMGNMLDDRWEDGKRVSRYQEKCWMAISASDLGHGGVQSPMVFADAVDWIWEQYYRMGGRSAVALQSK